MIIDKLFFYPDDLNYGGHPESSGLEYHEVDFNSTKDIQLHGWFVPSRKTKAKATIIHFHGNARNITNHWHLVDWIPKSSFNLFTFDYRGFGKSKGTPTFSGVYEDCISAINYVRNSEYHHTKRIVILGQSIGGTFSLSAIAKNNDKDIKGIIIDSSFVSFKTITNFKANLIPLNIRNNLIDLLINDDYSPIHTIKNLKIPKLFIHGTKDKVVPYECGFELFNIAEEPKQFLCIENGNHLSIFKERKKNYMNEVLKFLSNLEK